MVCLNADHLSRPQPRVSVIVVNYNGREHLAECLSNLQQQRYQDFEVLMVDCASNDGSVEWVQQHFSEVKVLRSEHNLGYAGAVNYALAHVRGEYVAVLNMDAMVGTGWLEPLVKVLDHDPLTGVVTPKILLYDTPERINALGQNVHITALGFNRALHRPDQPNLREPFRVSGLHGAAFLIRRSLLERMEGMNEACFLYHEDVDLSWLVQLMGYDILCVPTSTVRHKYVLAMGPEKLFYLERNRVAMLLTNLRLATLLWLTPFMLLTELMMFVYCLKRGPRFVAAKLRSLAWVWSRRDAIQQRQRLVRAIRRRSDREMVARMHLAYEWDQLIHLGRQRSGAGKLVTR